VAEALICRQRVILHRCIPSSAEMSLRGWSAERVFNGSTARERITGRGLALGENPRQMRCRKHQGPTRTRKGSQAWLDRMVMCRRRKVDNTAFPRSISSATALRLPVADYRDVGPKRYPSSIDGLDESWMLG